ncbi:hypothetical protein DICA3_B13586 [Diutina catenulata]
MLINPKFKLFKDKNGKHTSTASSSGASTAPTTPGSSPLTKGVAAFDTLSTYSATSMPEYDHKYRHSHSHSQSSNQSSQEESEHLIPPLPQREPGCCSGFSTPKVGKFEDAPSDRLASNILTFVANRGSEMEWTV